MTRVLKNLYLVIIFMLSVLWIYETFASIRDVAENTPYEMSENFVEKEADKLMELFLEDSTEFLLFTSFFIVAIAQLTFNIKEIESDVTNPPPELIIRIPVQF